MGNLDDKRKKIITLISLTVVIALLHYATPASRIMNTFIVIEAEKVRAIVA